MLKMMPRCFEFNGLRNLIPQEDCFPRYMKRKDLTTKKVGPFLGCLRKIIVPKKHARQSHFFHRAGTWFVMFANSATYLVFPKPMPNNLRDQEKIVTFGSLKDLQQGEIQNNHAFSIYLRHQILLSLLSIRSFAHN